MQSYLSYWLRISILDYFIWETKRKKKGWVVLIIPTCFIGSLHNLHNLIVKADFLLSKSTEQSDNFADVAWNRRFLNLKRKFEAFNLLVLCLSQPLSIRGLFIELRFQLKRKIPLVNATWQQMIQAAIAIWTYPVQKAPGKSRDQ